MFLTTLYLKIFKTIVTIITTVGTYSLIYCFIFNYEFNMLKC